MTQSNAARTRRADAEQARELLRRAATHNIGSSVRNDLVAEAAVWAALYQAGVLEETTGRNGETARDLGGHVEALGIRAAHLRQVLDGRVRLAHGGSGLGWLRCGGTRRQSARSTMTGAWSDGFSPLRAWRSIVANVARSATASVPSTRSMRMPRWLWKSPAR